MDVRQQQALVQEAYTKAAHPPKVPFHAAFISQNILGWTSYRSRLTGVRYRLVPCGEDAYLLYVDGYLVDKNPRTRRECLNLIELDNYD